MSAVEADFEREATQLLRNIGLRDVDELNYFQTSSSGGSNSSRSWKEGLRKPSEPRIRRFRSDFAVHPKVTGKPTLRPPQPSKLRPLPTNSLGNDRERPQVTRTKSAPPEDGKARPAASPSTNDLNCYIPKPVRVPMPTKKLCDVDGIQQSGTKVLYSRKSSLKILSVTSSNDTDVQFPAQTGPLRQKEADGTTTSVVPSVLYDSLERCQDVAPYSPEPLEDTEGSESPIGTKSINYDERGSSKSSIPRACRFTAATTHFGGSVNHQKLRQTSKDLPNSVDLSVAATESASVKVIHPHSNKTKDLLENQMSANPGPAVASMNIIASSTMQALSTLVDVVTSTSNKNVENDEKQAHGVSQLSKEDDHVETKPYPTKKNTSCREEEIVSELPSPPSPSMALVSNTKKHEATLHSQNAEFCIEDGDDFFGYCHQCGRSVVGEETGCLALGKVYHKNCLSCSSCHKPLSGKVFYTVDQSILCEMHYFKSLQRCCFCNQRIKDKVLTAFEEAYHPGCFRCSVCGVCLDGIPYALQHDKVFCIKDYHKLFAPPCSSCGNPIIPQPGKAKNVRVVVKGRYYHVRCYRCEDCGMLFAGSKKQCFLIDGHLFCPDCQAQHLSSIQTNIL